MRITTMLALLALAETVGLSGQNVGATPEVRSQQTEPFVELRISSEVVDRGDRMNVWVTTAANAHVAVLRFDTDGRVRMLQPERPWHESYVPEDTLLEVRAPSCDDAACAFVIDDYPGQGYVIAIASREPLNFDAFANGDYWDYGAIGYNGRVAGDPFVALSKLMERVVRDPDDNAYSYDLRPYHVGERFEYPRFLCYECHTHVRFPAWNPYQENCSRFQLVSYDGPAYQPVRAYADTRTVFTRPVITAPRFVFEIRDPDNASPSAVEERQEDLSAHRRPRVGASARDVGGVGSVPAPLRRQRIAPDSLLRRLTPLERALRDGRTLVKRTDSVANRLQPQLRRRRTGKPDTSGIRRIRPRSKPDTSIPGRDR